MNYTPIDTEESFKRIQEGAIVIDVRYPKEHNMIRIENSHNIPFKEITVEKINSITVSYTHLTLPTICSV